MSLINISRPNQAPMEGDWVQIGRVKKQYHAPVIVEEKKLFPVWSKVEFLLTVGEDVVDAIEGSTNKKMRYVRKLFDAVDTIDLNDERYMKFITDLNPLVIDGALLKILKGE